MPVKKKTTARKTVSKKTGLGNLNYFEALRKLKQMWNKVPEKNKPKLLRWAMKYTVSDMLDPKPQEWIDAENAAEKAKEEAKKQAEETKKLSPEKPLGKVPAKRKPTKKKTTTKKTTRAKTKR